MSEMIQIQQTLHGYRQGHQLLNASMEFSVMDRRMLDMMSDGAGISSAKCDGYITGYLLPETRKYVIAKTWYADEMDRPGCVWTHSLIFNLEDLLQIKDMEALLTLFCRPCKEGTVDYNNAVQFRQNDKLCLINTEKLQYIIYTIYSVDTTRYVEVESNGYEAYLLFAVSRMPIWLLEKFSFCTNSQINRCIGGRTLSYQMVMPENVHRVYHESVGGMLYKEKENSFQCPAWAREYARAVIADDIEEINAFVTIFTGSSSRFTTFNQLLRLYFITRDWEEGYSLNNYIDIVQKLFKDETDVYLEKIVSEYIGGNYFDELFLEDFIEMTKIVKKLKKKIGEREQEKLADKIIRKTSKKIPDFLDKYIHGELGSQEASLAQKIILTAKPEDLIAISKMSHDIVVVAVATNYTLVFSKDIWTQPRNFQCDVINAVDASIADNDWMDILSLVLENSSEDVSEAIYSKVQQNLTPILFELFSKKLNIHHENMLYIWEKYLLKDQIRLVRCMHGFTDFRLIKQLLLKINTYDADVRNAIPVSGWTELFRICSFEKGKEQMVMAIKMLPIILESGSELPVEFVAPVFGKIHQGLAASQIAFEDWHLFEPFLPPVEIWYAWDKCLRLRMAFMNAGYKIEELLFEFKKSDWGEDD